MVMVRFLKKKHRLKAKSISERISYISKISGWDKGTISGHCMRRGTTTQTWITSLKSKAGLDNTFSWLKRHQGWTNDKIVNIYINEISDTLCDTSNKVTGNKTNDLELNETDFIDSWKKKNIKTRIILPIITTILIF